MHSLCNFSTYPSTTNLLLQDPFAEYNDSEKHFSDIIAPQQIKYTDCYNPIQIEKTIVVGRAAGAKRMNRSFRRHDITLETTQRHDVVLKTLVRAIRRYYLEQFNKVTEYEKRARKD